MKILFFSDIHADWKALRTLMEIEADYYFCAGDLVSWGKHLARAGEILRRRAGRVLVIPGNHESAADIEKLCAEYGLDNVHGQTRVLGGVVVAALGYSNRTPFDTPGEYSEAQLSERLEPFKNSQPRVLVCHCPPFQTPLDCCNGGHHFGSSAIASFLDQVSPRYFICGHIHETEGVSAQLGPQGRTTGVNVGKRGYLLDLSSVDKSENTLSE